MKRNGRKVFLAIMIFTMLLSCLAGFAAAEEAEAPLYRTDVTEEDFIGTWKLKNMEVQGYLVPTETLGLNATIIIKPGQIEITDLFGNTKSYETTYEAGLLSFTDEDEVRMIVYITEEGMLHVDLEAGTFVGTTEDENAPKEKGGNTLNIAIANLDDSIINQYFEKTEE